MRIFAVRDRLMDYYMTPFAGHTSKEVMAQISESLRIGANSAIQQAPHHFELWELGWVDDSGQITPNRKFIADISTLVRPGREPAQQPGPEAGRQLADRKEPAGGSRDNGDPEAQPVQETGASEAQPASQAHRAAEGGYRGGKGEGEVGGYPFA